MLQKVYLLVVFCAFLQGCGSEDGAPKNNQISIESLAIETTKYFISAAIDDDLNVLSEELTNEFSSLVIEQTLLSGHSLLVISSIEDYELIESSNYEFDLTKYYAYNETSDFNEIVDWSRFFVSEADSLQWKSDIDNLYNLMPNDEVEINLMNRAFVGTIKKNEITDLGNRFVVVNLDSDYSGTIVGVYFGARLTSGKIYSGNDEPYEFEFDGDYGYVIPQYELRYIQGALGSQ